MNISDFLNIGIIGAFLSVIIEMIQRIFGTGSAATKSISILLAVGIGSAYYFLSTTPWWPSVLGVLAASSTVYALVFNSKVFKGGSASTALGDSE